MSNKLKILFYDIETMLFPVWVFRLGEQSIRHSQMMFNEVPGIICITYCWNDGKPVKALYWGHDQLGGADMITEFDALVRKADITIGKNSDSFDVKHINTQRLLLGLPPFPDWVKRTDDLQKQMRKFFKLPSQGLDFISEILGCGGKKSMEFSDWKHIAQFRLLNMIERDMDLKVPNKLAKKLFNGTRASVMREGKAASIKMVTYGKKDTDDTRKIWNMVEKHVEPKWNLAKALDH